MKTILTSTTLRTTYEFESAHALPRLADGHKCKRVHGHNFKLTVAVSGQVDPESGMLLDYADLDAVVEQHVIGELDHRLLNEVPGLENPTSENIAEWIWTKIVKQFLAFPRLYPQFNRVKTLIVGVSESARYESTFTMDINYYLELEAETLVQGA